MFFNHKHNNLYNSTCQRCKFNREMGRRGEKDLQWPIDSCPPLGVSIRRPSAQKSEFYLEFHYKPNSKQGFLKVRYFRMEMKILIWGCSASFSFYVIQAQTPGVTPGAQSIPPWGREGTPGVTTPVGSSGCGFWVPPLPLLRTSPGSPNFHAGMSSPTLANWGCFW